MKKFLKVLLIIVILFFILFFSYFYIGTYKATDDSLKKLESTDIVKVTKIEKEYFLFDGPGTDKAIVFYPGAKVEYTSYAKLLSTIAENGIDAFLIKMPCNFALFDSYAAENIISSYSYEHWFVGGHSLGGVAATNYAIANPQNIEKIINFASYPISEIPDNIEYISFYGSEDKILKESAYENAKEYWPENSAEYKIDGANHSSFANYGEQKGDGKATKTSDEVQNIVVEVIISEITENHDNI